MAVRAKKGRVSHFDRITIERSYPPPFPPPLVTSIKLMHVLGRFESPTKARVARPTIEMQSEREKSTYYSMTSDIRIVSSERTCVQK